jgi:hypothetical protein
VADGISAQPSIALGALGYCVSSYSFHAGTAVELRMAVRRVAADRPKPVALRRKPAFVLGPRPSLPGHA